MKKRTRYLLIFFAALASQSWAYAQQQSAGFVALSLNDLSAFTQPGKNWNIGSGAMADYTKPGAMTAIKGSGVAVNTPSTSGNSNLVTQTELGDVELELDFMLAK